MGQSLICPACKEGTMRWRDPNADDLLESGIMFCKKCDAEFKGIPGWFKATTGKDIKEALCRVGK